MEFAKKKFGQNFITDKNLINKIVSLLEEYKDGTVIEIGPGRGALTTRLVEVFHNVLAIEIDEDLIPVLISNLPNKNLTLLNKDVLEIDLNEEVKDKKRPLTLISNTPYYITSEILFKTLFMKDISKAVFMVQKEVAQRITAKVNENNYNNLSIATQLFCDVKYEFTVKKNMFKPVPKVDSAIISLTFNENNLKKVSDPEKFIKIVRQLFNNKRKTILNNLTTYIGDKETAGKLLDLSGIDKQLRPENIDIDSFIKLFNNIQGSV